MQADASALLRVLAILIGPLVAAGLAVLAALLLRFLCNQNTAKSEKMSDVHW